MQEIFSANYPGYFHFLCRIITPRTTAPGNNPHRTTVKTPNTAKAPRTTPWEIRNKGSCRWTGANRAMAFCTTRPPSKGNKGNRLYKQ